jgi:hypothetical protein
LTASPRDFAAELPALPADFADCAAPVPLSCAALRCLVAAPFFAAACRSAFVRCAMLLLPFVVAGSRRSSHFPADTRLGAPIQQSKATRESASSLFAL